MSGILLSSAVAGIPGAIEPALPSGSSINAGTCNWQLNNDGTYTISTDQTGNWVSPASATTAAQFQVKVDPTSGSFGSGTTGTWLDLSSNRAWTISDPPSPPAIASVTFDVSIREKATGIVRSTQTGLTLEATAT